MAVESAILSKTFKPEWFVQAMYSVVSTVFTGLLQNYAYDFGAAINGTHAVNPVMLLTTVGLDVSNRVEQIAASSKVQLTSIAMGSAEGFVQAEAAIQSASRTGVWVMLKNMHLAPSWLTHLGKKVLKLKPHASFRLIITCELLENIPKSFLKMSRVCMFEKATGVKSGVAESLQSILKDGTESKPIEKQRVYLQAVWLHNIVKDRLRYAPLGWSKQYDYNDSDLDFALSLIDSWIEMSAKGRQNVDPRSIPWVALKTIMKESVYGGRLENDFDQKVLNSLVDHLFSEKCFEQDFKLSEGASLAAPSGSRIDQYISWSQSLPNSTPAWSGLAEDAEDMLMANQGREAVLSMCKMSAQEDEDIIVSSAASLKSSISDTSLDPIKSFLDCLPEKMATPSTDDDSVFAQCLVRESDVASAVLKFVRQELLDAVAMSKGELKMTNLVRDTLRTIRQGSIPSRWLESYDVARDMNITTWIGDLSSRLKHLNDIAVSKAGLGGAEVCIGKLFSPEAFITASRQHAASESNLPLELLVPTLDFMPSAQQGINVGGVQVQGARWADSKLVLGSAIGFGEMPVARLSWSVDLKSQNDTATLPLYLHRDRSEVLLKVSVPLGSSASEEFFHMRSVALFASIA